VAQATESLPAEGDACGDAADGAVEWLETDAQRRNPAPARCVDFSLPVVPPASNAWAPQVGASFPAVSTQRSA